MKPAASVTRAALLLPLLLPLLLTWGAPAALGQLQLLTFDGVNEAPAPALFDAGSIAAGDKSEIRFRVRNLGGVAVSLATISAAGSAFAVTERPTLPYPLAPGMVVDFRVGFSPATLGSYSAVVSVNGLSVIVRATAVNAAEVLQLVSGIRVPVPANSAIDVGRVQRGQTSTQQMFLRNPGTTPLRVTRVATSGEAFTGSAGPLTLNPGESASFTITFAPARSAEFAGALAVDQRTFLLRGVGFDPPLPKPTVTLDAAAVRSSEQRTVTLRYSSPAPSNGAGTLQLFFDSAVTGPTADAAVQFVKTGSRTASFTIAQGDTQAKFGADAGAVFQTGTTAGTIRFQIAMIGQPTGVNDLRVSIAPSALGVDGISATRRIDALELALTAFDNTYSAGPAIFTFYDQNGSVVAPGAIRADFTADFKKYFAASQVGSAFQMRLSFPVSGDATKVATVEAEFTNSAGSAKTPRIPFP